MKELFRIFSCFVMERDMLGEHLQKAREILARKKEQPTDNRGPIPKPNGRTSNGAGKAAVLTHPLYPPAAVPLRNTKKYEKIPDGPAKKPEEEPKTLEELFPQEARANLKARFSCYVHTDEELLKVMAWARDVPYVGIDVETEGLRFVHDKVRLLQLCSEGTVYVIDLAFVSSYRVTELLEQFKGKPKYIHNAMFDVPRLCRWFGALHLVEDIFDTALASKHARAGEQEGGKQKRHNLKDCLARELGVSIPKDTEERKWKGALNEEDLRYAIDDAKHLEPLYRRLDGLIDEHDVRPP